MAKKQNYVAKVGGRIRHQQDRLDNIRHGYNCAGSRVASNLRVQRDDLPMDVFYRVLSKGKSK